MRRETHLKGQSPYTYGIRASQAIVALSILSAVQSILILWMLFA